nr:MAG TPA: hypothetical protein [Caudoviricetes sp.]
MALATIPRIVSTASRILIAPPLLNCPVGLVPDIN